MAVKLVKLISKVVIFFMFRVWNMYLSEYYFFLNFAATVPRIVLMK